MSHPETLGSYHVERELGRGGMGVVYLARDPRLNRLVAIKVIPDTLAQNPDSLARFEREAKLLAAVNHPNIGAIYGIEEVQGQRLLILEYIPGDTLSDLLTRGALPVPDALDVARQIAAAIEAAHEGGIIHRDLKPGNVKVTPEGLVKVLDFGLAKGGSASSSDLAQSPTLTYSPTAIGVILGTAGYMSPEQARGKPVDRRADIWAFACVLYECLTGRKAFEGETVSDTIARIIEREPDFNALPSATPQAVRELLRRCLEKDIRKRQRDIGDVRIELESALAAKSSMSMVGRAPAVVEKPSAVRRLATAALSAVLGAAIGITAWTFIGPVARPNSTASLSFSIDVPVSVRPTSVAFSKDGQSLIVLGYPKRADGTEDPNGRLYVRQLGSFDFTPIPGTEGTTRYARSPEGKWLAIVRRVGEQSDDSRLVRVPLDGSSPAVPIAEWGRDWGDLHWLQDGDLLIQSDQSTKFFRLPSGGGSPKAAIPFDLGPSGAGYATFITELPDGRGVVTRIEGWGPQGYQQNVWVIDASTGKGTRVLENASGAAYDAPSKHLIFPRSSVLMAVPFDLATLKTSGEPVALLEGLRANAWSHGMFDLSPSGTLLFEPGGRLGIDRRIVTVNAAREILPFASDARPFEQSLSVSRDGKQAAVVIANARGTYETWVAASDRPGLRRTLALPNADCADAVWSPDGQWLAFERNGRDTDDGVYVQRSDGSGEPKAVLKIQELGTNLGVSGWMPDGSGVFVTRVSKGKAEPLMVPVSKDGIASAPVRMRESKNSAGDVTPSYDGKLVAYMADDSGRSELYVADLVDGKIGGNALPVASDDVAKYRWTRDDDRLLFLRQSGRLMSIAIDQKPALRASPPVPVYDLKALRLLTDDYDVLPDGRLIGFQLGAGEEDVRSYNVILNWLDSARTRLKK